MIDEQVLIKRIAASVNKYFDSKKDSVRLFIEGQDIDLKDLNEWAELRLTGPRIRKLNGTMEIEIDINIMASAKPSNNIYRSQDIVGMFAKQMDVIPVFLENSNEKIGCFTLRNDLSHQLDIVSWGRVNPTEEISVIATSIEAFYMMEIQ